MLWCERRIGARELRSGNAVCLEDIQEFGFGDFKAQGLQCDFEFVVVYVGVLVEVEERELEMQISEALGLCVAIKLTASLISSLCSSLSRSSASRSSASRL